MSETEQFGWNALTVSFFLTVIVTLISCYVNWRQARQIWRLKSGHVVAVPVYLYLSAARIAMICYGWQSGSLGLTLSGALSFPMTAAILVGLVMYKKFSGFERCLAFVLAAMSGWTVWASVYLSIGVTSVAFIVWSIGFMVIASAQPLEIWRAKSAGAVTFGTVFAPTFSSAVWIAYALALGDWVLVAVSMPIFVIAVATTVLWHRYREPGFQKT